VTRSRREELFFEENNKMSAEQIEDLEQRYAELKSRIALVRSYL
jgi:hypothetical protein